MPKDNISLIGFMGSGKTTIGKMLANRIDYPFFDLDRIIELSEVKTINEIFKSSGEAYFREIESKVIKKVYSNTECIFACGGGVVLRRENMMIIRENSIVVYLEISTREAQYRLKKTSDRPLIESGNRSKKIIDLFEDRSHLYKKYADITIHNEGSSAGSTITDILKKIKDI